MTGHWESREQEEYFMELARQKQEQNEAEQRNYEYALEMENNKMTLTPEQRALYTTLAESYAETPGHEAELYRTIGELIRENEQLRAAMRPFAAVAHFPIFSAPMTDGEHRLTRADWKRLKALVS